MCLCCCALHCTAESARTAQATQQRHRQRAEAGGNGDVWPQRQAMSTSTHVDVAAVQSVNVQCSVGSIGGGAVRGAAAWEACTCM